MGRRLVLPRGTVPFFNELFGTTERHRIETKAHLSDEANNAANHGSFILRREQPRANYAQPVPSGN